MSIHQKRFLAQRRELSGTWAPRFVRTLLCLASLTLIAVGSSSAQPPPYLLQWGGLGSGDGQFVFSDFAGIKTNSFGDVFVCDSGNSRIQKFTSSGAFISKWGTLGTGPNQFEANSPNSIAIDDSSNIYAVSSGGGRIRKFLINGVPVAQWGGEGSGNGQFNLCGGVAVQGTTIYASDVGNKRIQKFNSSGVFLGSWGVPGTGDGQLAGPWGIAVESSGTLLVVDAGSGVARVHRFAADGQPLLTFGTRGSGPGQFQGPIDIAVAPDGKIYVTEVGNNRIQVFSTGGAYLTGWSSDGVGGDFNRPSGIHVNGLSEIYVVDHLNARVVKFGQLTPTQKTSWGRLKSMYR